MNIERAVQKMLAPAQRRLQNMILRGTVALSVATGKMQVLQIKGLADETLDGIEHFEPFGFTSRPLAGAEHITVFVDGDRSHGISVVVADRRARPTDLEVGDVAVHDARGQRIHFTDAGIVINGGGRPIRFVNTPSITHDDIEIGKTHTHGGVQAGSSNTSTPNG